MARQYFVYILTNSKNQVLYTGVTSDLECRLYEHQQSSASSFSSRYNLTKLVYYEVFNDSINAIGREKQIKDSPRKKKEELINRFNSPWLDLSEELGLKE